MNNKHYMIYYKQGTGTYIVTSPRAWAWENRHHFRNYDFVNRHPTVDVVEAYLVQNHGFVLQEHDNELVTVISNLNPTLIL